MMFAVIALVASAVVAHQLFFLAKRRRLAARSWQDVLAKVEPIHLESLQDVASVFLDPDGHQLRFEPDTVWEMLGGFEGVERLKRNADAMLELAVYAERWNTDHGKCVSELIRRDAVNLTRAVQQVEMAMVFRVGTVRAPFALLELAGHYELIRRRLIGIYQVSHAGLLPALEARI